MVDVDKVCSRREDFACVERGTRLHHDRPRVCVVGCLAGEVAGVEFFEGRVDVVRVEHDPCRATVVGVDLEDAERLGVERIGPLVSARHAGTSEGEALTAGRNDCRRNMRDPEVGERSHGCNVDVSTVLDTGVHDPTAIVGGGVVGQ